ncbi:hypothetical protein ACFXAF_28855 [Kitasatospora sp. NPDC059463]|uniref:hypothetical protein n=1 Tax=unclassified Kitasatospora TaxID=2633591 RepID=UPI00369EBA57
MTAHRHASPARSGLGRAYREQLAREGVRIEELNRDAAASRLLRITYPGEFLPTPVFVSAAERAALLRDGETVHRLLTELPDRLFGGDPGALAEAVGLTEVQARLASRAAAGPPPLRLARSDVYRDAEGFKLLEMNISSALGGAEIATLNRAMLGHPALARFTAEHGLGYVDTLQHFAATVRAACGGPHRTPVVALAEWPETFADYELWLHVTASLLEDVGIECVPCHVGELADRPGRLEARGRPVDAVVRFFLLDEIRTPQKAALLEPLLRAVDAGTVRLLSRMDTELYGNKGTLALLSDDRHRALCTPAERDCLDRFLPWTHFVRPVLRLPDGSTAGLERYARAEQPDLVLKPVLSHRGIGTVPGWTVPAATWLDRVRRAVGGPYVLQRRVVPTAEAFPAPDGGTREVYLNWGVFLTDPSATGSDGYGGCYIRASDDPGIGVIRTGPSTKYACAFHEEDSAAAAPRVRPVHATGRPGF